LSALPNGDHEFHITVGVRKKKNKKVASWRTDMRDWVLQQNIVPGIVKKAAPASTVSLIKSLVRGFGQEGGSKAFSQLGSRAIKSLGRGGKGTRGLTTAWNASPRLRQVAGGALTGAGLGSVYGLGEGYSEGGIPGALWGGFSRGMTGAGLGGIVGGLGGARLYKGLGSLRSGASKAVQEYAK